MSVQLQFFIACIAVSVVTRWQIVPYVGPVNPYEMGVFSLRMTSPVRLAPSHAGAISMRDWCTNPKKTIVASRAGVYIILQNACWGASSTWRFYRFSRWRKSGKSFRVYHETLLATIENNYSVVRLLPLRRSSTFRSYYRFQASCLPSRQHKSCGCRKDR